jgi:hypothetical protein
LRIRLKAGESAEAAMKKMYGAASKEGVAIDKLEVVAPQLEDVFVGVLEEAGDTREVPA